MNEKRFKETFDAINKFGFSDQGINRTAYSEEEEKAKKYLAMIFKNEGMSVKKDAVGNMIARREGSDPKLPAVACGSHIDTVYNAGKYDGTIGVIAGLEVIRYLNEEKITTKYPIEVIVFACEESARFGIATIGSKAMTNLIDEDELTLLKDKAGISIEGAMETAGYKLNEIEKARRHQDELKAFFELHIEQGPILETEEKEVGIVSGIAAPTRFQLIIIGKSAHSGSTPMNLRKDAFLGASEIALTLESIAQSETEKGTVATIGDCTIPGGAMNVVPGEAQVIIDIRSTSVESKNRVKETLLQKVAEVERERKLKIHITTLSDGKPIDMDEKIVESLKNISKKNGISFLEMPSGAGHDAMNMATLCPTGLIFVPSVEGLSHHPNEYTSIQDIGPGVDLLTQVILEYAEA